VRRRAAGPLAEGEGIVVSRGHNWCTAYQFARWKAASWHTSTLAAVDRSSPPTQMGGGRPSTSRRRVRGPPPWCHLSQCGRVGLRPFDLRGASRLICTASASTASQPHIVWPPVDCPSSACGAGAFVTSRATARGQGARLVLRAFVLWFAPVGWRPWVVRVTLLVLWRPPPPPLLPAAIVSGDGGGVASVGRAVGIRLGPRPRRTPPRSPPMPYRLGPLRCR
jgi:hypothetical protein